MSTAAPLLMRGISSLWIDERLMLRQFVMDDSRVHRILVQTHEVDRLPPYFGEDEVKERTWASSLEPAIPLISNRFPGEIRRKHTSATMKKNVWWREAILGEPQERLFQLSRTLSMVPLFDPGESSVREEVRDLTLLGIAPGQADILEKLGLKLFHLNLDALPETAPKRKLP